MTPEQVAGTRRLSIAGSTGSIGTQALDVVRDGEGAFEVVGLGAASSVDLLVAQAEEFRPAVVALADPSRGAELEARVPAGTEVRCGPGALASLADDEVDTVLNAVVGFAGLGVTVQTLERGKRLALANKESLIAGAPVVQRARRTVGAEILPVDSEHCAIHQCLRAASGRPGGEVPVRKIVLTASGGPFRGRKASALEDVSIEEALAHPTWSMGPKITIDSSTLMNKGLEVLEANELFGVGIDRIDVVVHPQSIVHSMVEFSDGATIAQLSHPDMKLPIAYCLAYPERFAHAYGSMDWRRASSLEFELPDLDTFRCLGLAFEAGRLGGAAPAWLNAANEVAVAAYLAGRLRWTQIAEVVAETLAAFEASELVTIDDVLDADSRARATAAVALAAFST